MRIITSHKYLRRRQSLTVTLLVFGYAGYYLCRSNFSVTLPLIILNDPHILWRRISRVQRIESLEHKFNDPDHCGYNEQTGRPKHPVTGKPSLDQFVGEMGDVDIQLRRGRITCDHLQKDKPDQRQ